MTTSPTCCLLILLLSFKKRVSGECADHYTAVRWLSGQAYAQIHHVPQHLRLPASLSFAHTPPSRRPLFSWDFPVESKITSERTLQPSDSKDGIEYDSESSEIKYKLKNTTRTVWWPWKNYKEWSKSREQNNSLKQIQPNSTTLTSIQPSNITVSMIKRKPSKRKYHGKKGLNKKRGHKKLKLKLNSHKRKSIIQTDSSQVLSRTTSNISKNFLNKTITFTDTNCTKMKMEYCKEYLLKNSRNTLEASPGKSDSGRKYKIDVFNGIPGYKKPIDDSKLVRHFSRKKSIINDGSNCFTNNAECDIPCVNVLGSYKCQCPLGFKLDSSGKNCIDINECIARNGHGPCQGQCINTRGSYRCSCINITGTKLASDGHSCEDIDECNDDTNGLNCSHGCINTVGTAFCQCPDGYELGPDWRNCRDIDECVLIELQDVKCLGSCVNTEGSYRCL